MQPDEFPKSLVEQDFCEKLGATMQPGFEYDGENKYQRGFVQLENGSVEINISCLNESDPTAPVEHVLSFMTSNAAAPGPDKNWLEQNLLPDVEAALRLLRETKNNTNGYIDD